MKSDICDRYEIRLRRLNLTRSTAVVFTGVMLLLTLAGCAYRLEGTVIDGPFQSLTFGEQVNPLHDEIAISEAAVTVTIDPRSLGAKQLPTVFTDDQGRFSIPIDEPGAGAWAEYEIEVMVRAPGYAPFADRRMLPFGNKRATVTLRRGRDHRPGDANILQETLEWKKQMDD